MSNAVRKIGAVGVPLNYRLTAEEATYVVDNSDAVVVFADTEFADFFAKIATTRRRCATRLIFDGPPAPDRRASSRCSRSKRRRRPSSKSRPATR